MLSKSMSLARGFPLECTFRMATLPLKSGKSTLTFRSKRPGRSNALSKMSALLVAAMTMIPLFPSKPSISVRIWLSVCSRSSFPPAIPAPLCLPTASISSMKMMHGAFFLAVVNRSRTLLAPTPTNISTNSDPEMAMKGVPASPATALAISVLPVPGGPSSITPRGMVAPMSVYLVGFFKKSTTSSNSNLAWSQPATSVNFVPVSG
mmetsp:Transcript_5549/g.8369  ORF Transcript_5549/g.8369 Transcript_5549/m.8369 type:complete len:206 (+) Transcript_5549:960-1577(+)